MPTAAGMPSRFEDEAALEDFMTDPSSALTRDLSAIDGDITILGASGKMRPTLAYAIREIGLRRDLLPCLIMCSRNAAADRSPGDRVPSWPAGSLRAPRSIPEGR